MRIGLLDHMGWGNLGDAAIQDAVIQNIRRKQPDAIIHGFSLNPADTARRHNITSFPIRRGIKACISIQKPAIESDANLNTDLVKASGSKKSGIISNLKKYFKRHCSRAYGMLSKLKGLAIKTYSSTVFEAIFIAKSYQRVKKLGLLVVSGGGQFSDLWGGAFGHPYTILTWALLCRVAGTDFVILSVGVGPLDSRASKIFLRIALNLAKYKSFRDLRSKKLIYNEVSADKRDMVCPDMAYSLEWNGGRETSEKKSVRSMIGVSPMAYMDPRVWPKKNSVIYQEYLKQIFSFISWALLNDYNVLLFYSQIRHDSPVVEDLQRMFAETDGTIAGGKLKIGETLSVDDLMEQIAATDYVVASRLHSIILAHNLIKPTLAVSDDLKVDSIMEAMELSDYCLKIRGIEFKLLIEKFEMMVEYDMKVRGRIEKKVREFRKRLEEQYDAIFGRGVLS